MSVIDRRTLLRTILPGAAVTAVGVTALASGGARVLIPAAEAMPLALDKTKPLEPLDVDELFQQAQWGPPPRRRYRRYRRRVRRWTCWWYRGRRRCGWRWGWV